MIEPDFLDELDRFEATRERPARRQRRGERDSPASGEGLTFSDYRRYTPGDHPRDVDWKLYGRTEELYVTEYEEERQATVHVLVDASASMAFEDKFEVAAKLGLGVAYLTAREHDEFRFSVLSEGVERIDDGTSTAGQVLRLIERCNESEPAGETAIEEALATYAGTISSSAVVVVLSDFLADPGAIDAGLGALAAHDLVLGHVLAAEERAPPVTGDAIFEDPEGGSRLRTYFGRRLETQYRDRLRAHVDEVAAVADGLGARHERVDTDDPFFDAFADLWLP